MVSLTLQVGSEGHTANHRGSDGHLPQLHALHTHTYSVLMNATGVKAGARSCLLLLPKNSVSALCSPVRGGGGLSMPSPHHSFFLSRKDGALGAARFAPVHTGFERFPRRSTLLAVSATPAGDPFYRPVCTD